jgi:hypothetical protein
MRSQPKAAWPNAGVGVGVVTIFTIRRMLEAVRGAAMLSHSTGFDRAARRASLADV